MTDGVTPSHSEVSEIVSAIRESTSCAICIPAQSSHDVVASALALADALHQEGKGATVVATDGIDPAVTLHGVERISRQFTADGDVLKVIVPFTGEGIENVSYNIEANTLNILITPEKGYERIKTEDVTFTYAGGKPDLVIVLYAPTLSTLGSIYEANKDTFDSSKIINIDTHGTNTSYGTLNLLDLNASSMVQLVNEILRELKTQITPETARNLYDALMSATQNFTGVGVNAKTFRMAAFLIDHMADVPAVSVSEAVSQPAPVNPVVVEQPEVVAEPEPAPAPSVTPPGFQPTSPISSMQQPQSTTQLKPNIFQGPASGMNKG